MEPSRRASLRVKKRLSNFNRAGEGGEEGGRAASIAIAEGLVTRIEPTFGLDHKC